MDTLRTYTGRKLNIEGGTTEISTNLKVCAELDANGEDLYIAYLAPDNIEYVYWFKKCLFNMLYSFYRVGYRTSSNTIPDTYGINTEVGITWLNRTYSDNIGPLSTNSGGWTGGNHSWKNDNKTKTAQTDSYIIEADGYALMPSDKVYCEKVMISVINTIFDPSVAPNEGDESLSTPFSTESVVYIVEQSSINVSVRQKLAGITNNWLKTYYGMQSMFDGETAILTPNGQYLDWETSISGYSHFNKADYPRFNRFVEKNAKGYQSSYVQPYKLGNHDKTAFSIFERGTNKSYHVLVNSTTNLIPVGGSIVWCGVYTFFKTPIIDNEYVFAYSGIVNGNDTIFIWAKKAYEGTIPMPVKYQMRLITNIEKDNAITTGNTMIDAEGVSISASAAGSWIFHL